MTFIITRHEDDAWVVGAWSGGAYPAPGVPYPTILSIKADGTYTYLEDRGRWHAEGDTLFLESPNEPRETPFILDKKRRLMSDGITDGLSFSKGP